MTPTARVLRFEVEGESTILRPQEARTLGVLALVFAAPRSTFVNVFDGQAVVGRGHVDPHRPLVLELVRPDASIGWRLDQDLRVQVLGGGKVHGVATVVDVLPDAPDPSQGRDQSRALAAGREVRMSRGVSTRVLRHGGVVPYRSTWEREMDGP